MRATMEVALAGSRRISYNPPTISPITTTIPNNKYYLFISFLRLVFPFTRRKCRSALFPLDTPGFLFLRGFFYYFYIPPPPHRTPHPLNFFQSFFFFLSHNGGFFDPLGVAAENFFLLIFDSNLIRCRVFRMVPTQGAWEKRRLILG